MKVLGKFTAAQAAQKNGLNVEARDKEFTAAQAAQKIRNKLQ